MCGRFTITVSGAELAELLEVPVVPQTRPRYNVSPSQNVLAARLNESGQREAVELKWGLVPWWSKDAKIGYSLINARCETIAEKPSFREAFRKRRCLIPADGFFEWKVEGKKKLPYRFRRPDGKPFLFAGLWEYWDGGDQPLETCTILTTTANQLVSPIDERMPIILSKTGAKEWLSPGLIAPEVAAKLLVPSPDDFLMKEAVNPIVNSPKNDNPSCIEVVA
jgi:putative SOS response-associated peptidase YedK